MFSSRFRFASAVLTLLCLCPALLLASCSQSTSGMQDGYYTAQAAEYDTYGWKEYITICVQDDRILGVEYDARNSSGFIKSWDMEYMREMNAACGTYPNEYTRAFAGNLVGNQAPNRIDAITGATHSYHAFQQLAEAAIAQAKSGDKNIAYVEILGATEDPKTN